jgi:hypothetical protein
MSLENQPLSSLQNIDIYGQVGANAPLVIDQLVTVTDGSLSIQVGPGSDSPGNVENAKLSAFSVFSESNALAPAGVAGNPINLALTDPSANRLGAVSVTVVGIPSGWTLSEGTNKGDGSWTVQTNDINSLSITSPETYAGALTLHVTESWTNADGSTGSATIADNVEAYAPGSPIFAISGNDTLTGGGANSEFAFAQPVGNDTIYSFNVASDQIYLIGFSNIASFSNIQANMADDANGNAVITLASGETITLMGIDAASLTASNFVFNQEPVTNNTGLMTISDGAILPLGGTIDNTGTIALNSTGDATELEILVNGVTLQGGGHLILSDNSQNVIFGVSADATLTNVDNTISGAGQVGFGDGTLTLINEIHGIIEANDADGVLTLYTGHSITNAGLLEASNGATLLIKDDVSGGTATITGGTLIFNAQSNVNVTFDNGGTPTYGDLVLADAPAFSGQIFGFTGTAPGVTTSDAIDLTDINFANLNSDTYTENSTRTGGTLTVSDGTNTANLFFSGDYTLASFNLASDGQGGTLLTDPPPNGTTITSTTTDSSSTTTSTEYSLTNASTDTSSTTSSTDSSSRLPLDVDQTAKYPMLDSLPQALQNAVDQALPHLSDLLSDLTDIAFGADTTLGYSPNTSGIGCTPGVSDGTHTTTIALFSQFAAAGFQLGNNNNGALVTHPSSLASENEVLITNPNHTP